MTKIKCGEGMVFLTLLHFDYIYLKLTFLSGARLKIMRNYQMYYQ